HCPDARGVGVRVSVESAEATKEFGKNFVETYWGALGERCPHSMMLPGNKEIFFTVSRQPVQSLKQQMDQDSTALPTRSPRLG
uniref:hypothetical protein n=2 Tax=Pseudomonas aeruginosa TaxID=287 RepID=UPI001C4A12B6